MAFQASASSLSSPSASEARNIVRVGHLIGLFVLTTSACGVTEPAPLTMLEVEGTVLSGQDATPLSARIRIEHEEGDGDWVWTSYRTVVDAETVTDASGWFYLRHQPAGCGWYTLVVEADGFIPYKQENLTCQPSPHFITVRLIPGWCKPTPFGCAWVPSKGITLLSPPAGASIVQNNATIGCAAHPTRGYGFGIRFAWMRSTHLSTSAYRLVVRRAGSAAPWLDVVTRETEYTSTACQTFVADQNLTDWTWTVTAVDDEGTPVEVSDQGRFQFLPCRLSDGSACCA